MFALFPSAKRLLHGASAVAPSKPNAIGHADISEISPIRIAVAMSDELARMAWGLIIDNEQDMQIIAATASCDELLVILKFKPPDLVLLDEAVLDDRYHRELLELSRHQPACRFILVARHKTDYSLEQSSYEFIHARLLTGASAADLLKTIRETAQAPLRKLGLNKSRRAG